MDSIDPSATAAEVDGAGPAGTLSTAVVPVDAVHPPRNKAVSATIAVVMIFMVVLVCPFLVETATRLRWTP